MPGKLEDDAYHTGRGVLGLVHLLSVVKQMKSFLHIPSASLTSADRLSSWSHHTEVTSLKLQTGKAVFLSPPLQISAIASGQAVTGPAALLVGAHVLPSSGGSTRMAQALTEQGLN